MYRLQNKDNVGKVTEISLFGDDFAGFVEKSCCRIRPDHCRRCSFARCRFPFSISIRWLAIKPETVPF